MHVCIWIYMCMYIYIFLATYTLNERAEVWRAHRCTRHTFSQVYKLVNLENFWKLNAGYVHIYTKALFSWFRLQESYHPATHLGKTGQPLYAASMCYWNKKRKFLPLIPCYFVLKSVSFPNYKIVRNLH